MHTSHSAHAAMEVPTECSYESAVTAASYGMSRGAAQNADRLSLSMADVATMPRSSHPLSTGGPDLRRRVYVSVFAALAVLGIVSCSSSDGATPPHKNTTAVSPTTTRARTTPPKTTLDSLAGYTPEQVQAYQEALLAFRRSQVVHARVFAAGEATPRALMLLKSVEFDASSDWALLKTLSSVHYTLTGYDFPISNPQPTRIALSKNGSGSVTITMCTDPRGLREHYPNGRIFRPPRNGHPYKQSVVMSRFSGGPWKGSTGKKLGPC